MRIDTHRAVIPKPLTPSPKVLGAISTIGLYTINVEPLQFILKIKNREVRNETGGRRLWTMWRQDCR
jgi:hypothetical protein